MNIFVSRYQACVSAGMVADLVMSEKERLSRIRLVDQNRERRRGGNQDTPTHQDAKVLALVEQIYSQYFPAGQEYNFTQGMSGGGSTGCSLNILFFLKIL